MFDNVFCKRKKLKLKMMFPCCFMFLEMMLGILFPSKNIFSTHILYKIHMHQTSVH